MVEMASITFHMNGHIHLEPRLTMAKNLLESPMTTFHMDGVILARERECERDAFHIHCGFTILHIPRGWTMDVECEGWQYHTICGLTIFHIPHDLWLHILAHSTQSLATCHTPPPFFVPRACAPQPLYPQTHHGTFLHCLFYNRCIKSAKLVYLTRLILKQFWGIIGVTWRSVDMINAGDRLTIVTENTVIVCEVQDVRKREGATELVVGDETELTRDGRVSTTVA